MATLEPMGTNSLCRRAQARAALCSLLASWPEAPTAFAARCAAVTDWEGLVAAAEHERVIGLLARPLLELVPGCSGPIRARIEERQALERFWQGRLLDTLDDVTRVLEVQRIPAVHLKGPVLSERLYGAPQLRPSSDIDLLLRPAELPRAVAALEGLGYQCESAAEAQYQLRYHHHLCLVHPRRPPVELHFRGYVGFGIGIEAEDLCDRAQPYSSPRGPSYLVLSAEDELLYLCVHAVGHAFAHLLWLYDLKAFLRQHPALDGAALVGRARSWQVGVVLAFALLVAERMLDVDSGLLERRLRPELRRARGALRLLQWVDAAPATSWRAKVLALLLRSRLCARWSLALRQLRHHGAHGLFLPMAQHLARRGAGESGSAARLATAISTAEIASTIPSKGSVASAAPATTK